MPKKTKKNLTALQRQEVIYFLLQRSKNGRLSRGDINACAQHFDRHRNTIARIWKIQHDAMKQGIMVGDVTSQIKRKSGRKPKDLTQYIDAIKNIPPNKRMSMRALASELKVSMTIVRNLIKAGIVQFQHDNSHATNPRILHSASNISNNNSSSTSSNNISDINNVNPNN